MESLSKRLGHVAKADRPVPAAAPAAKSQEEEYPVFKEEAPENLGVSVLCPGLVNTGLWNSTRNRPERYGGMEEGADFARQIMGEGMSLEEVGRRAIDGLEAEEFLIVTHSQSQRYAKNRWETVSGAFERQAPYDEKDERYDLQNVIGKLLGGG